MINSKSISLFEFGFLSGSEKANSNPDVEKISLSAYQELKALCKCEGAESRFLRSKIFQGMEVLQVQNYVGVIVTRDGTQIEVLPKIGKSQPNSKDEVTDSRAKLLLMLKTLKQFRHLQTKTANIEKQKMPLLEVFISQFISSLESLIKRGLRSDYVRREDNLAYLKGKLNVGKQLQHNFINKHKFYVEYDEFLQDRPANRLLHSALRVATKLARSAQNQKRLKELEFIFHEIPTSKDHKLDFKQTKLDRSMTHYELSLEWAVLILSGFSPLSMQGKNTAVSLLFPMEKVFEAYVGATLRKQLSVGYKLKEQAKFYSLVKHGSENWFQLMPDFLIQQPNRTCVVLDAKWKLLDSSKNKGSDKYGLSQADFYQMFAYGHSYLQGQGDMFLIYPKHHGFSKPLEHSFDFSGENSNKLRLWVVPFDIDLAGNSNVIWPKPKGELMFLNASS